MHKQQQITTPHQKTLQRYKKICISTNFVVPLHKISDIMSETSSFVYNQNTIDFVTVAAQVCLLLEHINDIDRAEFTEQALRLLPLLYLRTRMLEDAEMLTDGDLQHFVQEEDYCYVQLGIQHLLGSDDNYLDVMVDDMRYNDEPITVSISENIADIYQEIKDMAANFQTGQEAIMQDAVLLCREAFNEHWGQKLLNATRALHILSLAPQNED